MGRDVEIATGWDYDEEPLTKATRLAAALEDLLEQAATDASAAHRTEIRYIEALARTLSDCLASVQPGRAT